MNPIVCGNCQTENPGGSDVCDNCGEPLTRSAESAVVENEVAMERGGGIFGSPSQHTPGTATTRIAGTDTPVNDGLPTD